MTFTNYTLTASGGTIDNKLLGQAYANLLITAAAPLTLTGNFVINPTVVSGMAASFQVRWSAVATLSTFSVTICGVVINQDLVNQRGTFDCYYDGAAWTVLYYADGKDQPQIQRGVVNVTVPTGGGTRTLVAGVDEEYQRLQGTTTLTSNYTVTADTTGVKDGTTFTVLIGGGVTLDGNTMTVFGLSISAFDALNGGAEVRAVYSLASTTWRATYVNKPIAVGNIQSVSALTVLANGTNATAAPSALPFTASLQVLTRIGSVLAPDFLTPDHLTAGGMATFVSDSYALASANILTLFSTPLAMIAPPRPGRIWNMMNPVMKLTYGTTPYATNTDLAIRYVGATNPIFIATGALAATGTGVVNFVPVEGEIIEGATLEIYVPSGNPTAGDSTIRIYFELNEKLLA
jgi:hypothetical protein